MKNLSYLIAVFILVASFGAPLLAVAQQAYVCNPPCSGNLVCNSNGTCVQSALNSTSGTPGSVNQTYLRFYYDLVLTVVNSYLVPILIAVSFIVFLWGVFNYFIYGADDETKRKEGKQFVLWGIIGLVIIFSTWALVNIVKSTIIPSGAKDNAPAYPKL